MVRSRRQSLADVLHASGLVAPLSWLRSALRRDVRILAYHRTLTIPDEDAFAFDLDLVSASEQQFRAQMDLLRRRFHPIRFADVVESWTTGRPLPPRAVIVTFDDGYDDNYRVAFPILRELGVPATFFVSTGHIDSGRVFAYDWLVHMVCRTQAERIGVPELDVERALPPDLASRRALAAELLDRMKYLDADVQSLIVSRLETEWAMPRGPGHPDCRPMTWAQLREMREGGMEIGSHGVWHNMLARLDPGAMAAEVVESKRALDRELGEPVQVISYPVGGSNAYDDEVIRVAREAGFVLGCSYVAGTNPIPVAPSFELRRLPVERHMDLAWFACLIGLPEGFSYPSRQRNG